MKKMLVRWKVYVDRSRGYMSIVQFVAIMYMSLNMLFEKHGVRLHPIAIVAVVGALFLLLVLFGRLEYTMGFFREENRRISETNPVTMEILNGINEIKDKIK